MAAKAYSYLRFSTPEQLKGDSFRRQSQLAADYAALKGLTLDDKLTFQDLGVSAYRGKNAETGALALFKEAVEAGLVPQGSYLLVESLDRISRQAARKAQAVLNDIVDAGITVVTLADNREYTSESLDNDPMSLIMSILVFIRANEESLMKSKRLKAAWVRRREGTKSIVTSACPSWMEARYESAQDGSRKFSGFHVIPERAAIVRRIFFEYLGGNGTHAIAQSLNGDKVPPFTRRIGKDAQRWHPSYIMKVLRNRAVLGEYQPNIIEHQGKKKRVIPHGDPIKDYFPSVIDPETFLRAQSLTGRFAKMGEGTGKVSTIFAGLLVCARCGGSMTVTSKRSYYRYAVCAKAKNGAGCKYQAVRYESLVDAFMRDREAILGLRPSSDAELEAELDQVSHNLSELEDTLGRYFVGYERTKSTRFLKSIELAEAEQAQLKERLRELRKRHEETTGPVVDRRIKELRECLEAPEMDVQLTNAQMRQLFTGIAVDPDAGTFTVGWRHGGASEVVYSMPSEA